MTPSVSSTSTPIPSQLAKFPLEARESYGRYQATGDTAAADIVVLAILRDYAPKQREGAAFPDSLRLIEDLGFDSLAVAETVFFIEDLFSVKITNEDLVTLRSVGELRAFVVAKLATKTRSA
jgi:acyl carrier protein